MTNDSTCAHDVCIHATTQCAHTQYVRDSQLNVHTQRVINSPACAPMCNYHLDVHTRCVANSTTCPYKVWACGEQLDAHTDTMCGS